MLMNLLTMMPDAVEHAAEVATAVSTMNWSGVVVIILVIFPIYIWLFLQGRKNKENEPLTKSDLEAALANLKMAPTCLFDKKVLEGVEDKILENKDLLRDVVNQIKTENTTVERVEDNVERVRKNLADLVESLRKIVR